MLSPSATVVPLATSITRRQSRLVGQQDASNGLVHSRRGGPNHLGKGCFRRCKCVCCRLAGPQWCQCWRSCVAWFQRGSFHVGVLGCASAGGLCLLFLTWSSPRWRLQVSFSACWSPWRHSVFVDAMTTRHHSTSRSPAKRDACRMSQTSTIAASSQPVSLMLTPTPARADLPDAQLPALPQSPGALLEETSPHRSRRLCMLNRAVPRIVGTRLSRLLRRFQGILRLFTSRMLTPLHVHALPPFSHAWLLRDGHYWCSKCPRRGFTTIPGLMHHVTHQHAGSSVDEATCSLFAAIERVTCTAPACGGLRRMGARVCNRCGQASQARPPRVGDVIMGPLGAPASREDVVMADVEAPATPSLTVDLPSLASRLTSRNASVRFPQAPFCTSLPAAVCA